MPPRHANHPLPAAASVQSDDLRWQQLCQRDSSANFCYAVLTTGIYCRPGCASRLPLRRNVRFFASAAAARAAGFRACQRCHPDAAPSAPLAAQVRTLLDEHLDSGASGQLPLARLARRAGSSAYAVQRAFRAAFGLSPSQYLAAQRARRFAQALAQSDQSITAALHAAGYSSSSRAYTGSPLGLTPGSLRRGAAAEAIAYAIQPCTLGGCQANASQNQSPAQSPFPTLNPPQDAAQDPSPSQPHASSGIPGYALAASSRRGLCWLAFGDAPDSLLADLRRCFHAATLSPSAELDSSLRTILACAGTGSAQPPLPLDLRGTAFQLRVWAALQQIPPGQTRSYSQLAGDLGQPTATRAVARACATNRVALLVPCHRVVAANGALSGYRWGTARKQALLETERNPTKQETD